MAFLLLGVSSYTHKEREATNDRSLQFSHDYLKFMNTAQVLLVNRREICTTLLFWSLCAHTKCGSMRAGTFLPLINDISNMS